MDKIRVMIIDEHIAVRRALAARLSSFAHIDVVATARNIQEGVERARRLLPDVVLLELKGKDSQQSDPVGEMGKALEDHQSGVIVLTSYADEDERQSALQAGANRYLLKHIDSASLMAEIEAVVNEFGGQEIQPE
jgi:DNA-binding NarL/FixJ family response regulator